jgi:hypothetical protein
VLLKQINNINVSLAYFMGKNDIISASEIGQYTYCSISWYLQRSGFQPKSPLIEKGKKNHEELGRTINNIQNEMTISKRLILYGFLILIFTFILTLFGVIL